MLITIYRGWHEACNYKGMKQNKENRISPDRQGRQRQGGEMTITMKWLKEKNADRAYSAADKMRLKILKYGMKLLEAK